METMDENEYIEVRSRLRRVRQLTIAYNSADGVRVPSIRFSGSYLEDLGYDIGGKYELSINHDNTITIRPVIESQAAPAAPSIEASA